MRLLTFILCLLFTHLLVAQEALQYRPHLLSPYAQNGKMITHWKVRRLLEKGTVARDYYNRSQGLQLAGGVFAEMGLLIIVFAAESNPAEGGSRTGQLITAGLGVTSIGLAIPLYLEGARNGRRAVEAYNASLSGTPPELPRTGIDLRLGTTAHGLGLQARFGR